MNHSFDKIDHQRFFSRGKRNAWMNPRISLTRSVKLINSLAFLQKSV